MSSESTALRPRRAPRRERSDGQWAKGDRAPLNPNEEIKAAAGGLGVRERVLSTYARGGFASIPGDDLRGRLRWWGLYTQRRPGIDGGRTATLEPHELDDEYFMLRVRIDGGAVTVAQLRVLAEISTRYARGTADVTDRQNIQYHWIRIEDMPAIWDALEAAGLQTTEACGDTPRVVLGSPVAGIAADEILDGTPAIRGDHPAVRRRPRAGEPAAQVQDRRQRQPAQDVAHEIHDIAFVGVDHPDHGPGFDLWVGGGLSTSPMLAQRLGRLGPAGGGRRGLAWRHPALPGLRLPPAAQPGPAEIPGRRLGPAGFREVLEKEYLGRTLLDGPGPAAAGTGASRPRRRAPAAGRPVLRRGRPGRRAGQRPGPGRAGGRRGTGRQRAGPVHPGAEDRGPRRRGTEGRGPARRAGRDRPDRAGLGVPAGHDGVHRDRVLQARDRRDEGDRGDSWWPSWRRRFADVPELFTPDGPALSHQHQRLPELLRPRADRGHRARRACSCRTRPTHKGRRSRASSCISAAASAPTPGSAASCAG